MRWIRTVADQIFGLFVEDGSFVAAILAWLALVWLVAARDGIGSAWAAVGFFVGLAAILIESAARRSRR